LRHLTLSHDFILANTLSGSNARVEAF